MNNAYESINYYRSETSLNLGSLPPYNMSININETESFIDSSAIKGKRYYVILSSVNNGIEKYSKEITVYNVFGSRSIWSYFASDFHDDTTDWASFNSPTIENSRLKLIRANSQYMESSFSSNYHFNSGEDVTIRCILNIEPFSSDYRVLLTTRRDETYARNWAIYLVPNGIKLIIWDGSIDAIVLDKTWSSIYNFNEEFELSLERKDMNWNLYINGSAVESAYTQLNNYTPYVESKLTIGSETNVDVIANHTRDFDGTICKLQFIKNQALGEGLSNTPLI